jgi:hypothetical protein
MKEYNTFFHQWFTISSYKVIKQSNSGMEVQTT